MSWLGDWFAGSGSAGRQSLIQSEAELETHLQVIQLWLTHEETKRLRVKVNKSSFDKLESAVVSISRSFASIKRCIQEYDNPRRVITIGKDNTNLKDKQRIEPGQKSEAVWIRLNLAVHRLDALRDILKIAAEEIARTAPKELAQHAKIPTEAANAFSNKLKQIEEQVLAEHNK